MSDYEMLSNDHPVVKGILAQNNIKPVKNGDPAVEQGSRIRLPKTQVEEAKPKKVQVSLTVEQQAVLIREAATKGLDLKQHLQNLVNDLLSDRVGKATIAGASFMGSTTTGKKITGPSKSFGRDDANQ